MRFSLAILALLCFATGPSCNKGGGSGNPNSPSSRPPSLSNLRVNQMGLVNQACPGSSPQAYTVMDVLEFDFASNGINVIGKTVSNTTSRNETPGSLTVATEAMGNVDTCAGNPCAVSPENVCLVAGTATGNGTVRVATRRNWSPEFTYRISMNALQAGQSNEVSSSITRTENLPHGDNPGWISLSDPICRPFPRPSSDSIAQNGELYLPNVDGRTVEVLIDVADAAGRRFSNTWTIQERQRADDNHTFFLGAALNIQDCSSRPLRVAVTLRELAGVQLRFEEVRNFTLP